MRSETFTRNPVAEPRPRLNVSSSVLTFPDTTAGQPQFQVLTLVQEAAETPVTLTTDAPDFFHLASDERPQFAPNLTLTPRPEGTHVHVRYLAGQSGRHVGQLLVQSPYDTKAVTLHARSGRLLSLVPSNTKDFLRPQQPVSNFWQSPWGRVLALALISGLALVGYGNRCRLAPRLCDETTTVATTPERPVVRSTPAAQHRVSTSARTEPAGPKRSWRTYRRTSRHRRSAQPAEIEQTAEQPAVEAATQPRLSGATAGESHPTGTEARERRRDDRRTARSRRRSAPETQSSDVSELERELNRNPNR